MRVNARILSLCTECSNIGENTLEPEYTIQWIVEAPEPKRGSWGTRKPAKYKCQECGTENLN